METPNFRENNSPLKLHSNLQKTIQNYSTNKEFQNFVQEKSTETKNTQKEQVYHKTQDSLHNLEGGIMVEVDGQKMSFKEFEKRYPHFFKKSRKSEVDLSERQEILDGMPEKKLLIRNFLFMA